MNNIKIDAVLNDLDVPEDLTPLAADIAKQAYLWGLHDAQPDWLVFACGVIGGGLLGALIMTLFA